MTADSLCKNGAWDFKELLPEYIEATQALRVLVLFGPIARKQRVAVLLAALELPSLHCLQPLPCQG